MSLTTLNLEKAAASSRRNSYTAYRAPGEVSIAPNITSHPDKGIGTRGAAEIKRTITKGISRDGRELGPAMAFNYHDRVTDADLDAIVAYLRTVPPRD